MLAEVCGEGDRAVCVVGDGCMSTDCETVGVSVKSERVMRVSGEVCVLCKDDEEKSAGSEVLYLRREEEEDKEEEESGSCWCGSGFGFSNEK